MSNAVLQKSAQCVSPHNTNTVPDMQNLVLRKISDGSIFEISKKLAEKNDAGATLLVGRHAECDIVLRNDEPYLNVSRKHCYLRLQRGVLEIMTPSTSVNGTYLNHGRSLFSVLRLLPADTFTPILDGAVLAFGGKRRVMTTAGMIDNPMMFVVEYNHEATATTSRRRRRTEEQEHLDAAAPPVAARRRLILTFTPREADAMPPLAPLVFILRRQEENARPLPPASFIAKRATNLPAEVDAENTHVLIKECSNCVICFQTFVMPHALPCGHVSCGQCMAKWFRVNQSCPMCRAPGGTPAYVKPLDDIIRATIVPSMSKDERARYDDACAEWDAFQQQQVSRNALDT